MILTEQPGLTTTWERLLEPKDEVLTKREEPACSLGQARASPRIRDRWPWDLRPGAGSQLMRDKRLWASPALRGLCEHCEKENGEGKLKLGECSEGEKDKRKGKDSEVRESCECV